MDSGKVKFYLSVIGTLAYIFAAATVTASLKAGAVAAGAAAVLFLLYKLWSRGQVEEANNKFLLAVIGVLTTIYLGLGLLVSATAALIAVGLALALIVGGFVFFVMKFQKLSKAAQAVMSLDIRLEPQPGRPDRNRPAVESLAAELAALGFVPAGFFKIPLESGMFIEGWARPDLRLYASITECGEAYPPYADLTAFYADGGSFSVNACGAPQTLDRPANMIDVRLPGVRPAELLNIMMQRRPAAGLLEALPENFKTVFEEELTFMREYMMTQAGGGEEE